MRELLKKIFAEQRKRDLWMRVVYMLAVVVTFVTTYCLIIPAITLSRTDLNGDPSSPQEVYTSGAAITAHDAAVFTSGAAITLEPDPETYPAQQFTGSAGGVDVSVEADVLTFPLGTEMTVSAVTQEDILVAASCAAPGKATQVQAVDICFTDADGCEIEPLQPVRVSLTSSDVPESGDHYIVHVDDHGIGRLVDTEMLPVVARTLKLLKSKAPLAAEPVQDNSGCTFTFETDAFSVYAIVTTDPDSLDGCSYGILNNQDTVSGTALQANATNNGTSLGGKTLTVRTDPVKRNENVFVAQNSNIVMWSFHRTSENTYHITAEVNGQKKYLRIAETGVTLVDASSIDASCEITVDAGSGVNTGKYRFHCGSYALRLDGGSFKAANKSDANTWMNLAELSTLKDDDFVVYTATKVSVSGTVNDDGTIDYDVQDGDQVIIYTRIWNDNTKRYDYYTIDYDGMLVRAYESGDTISWVGTKVNTMLWDFTEYHYDDGTPNYYYELQNSYSGKYMAPQVTGGGAFLSDHTIGINLNGRRNREYYTTVLAWDDLYYDYASLKVQNWQLTSAPISKADTFYFAVMKPAEAESSLTEVATMDHKPFGITLKMQDYGNINSSNRSQTQVDVLGNTKYEQWTGTKDLLKKYIAEGEDYPLAANGRSLGDLYNDAMEVNQQFLLSTYKETGYFEYDSTQNFAHLIWSDDDPWIGRERPDGGTYSKGDFVIYEQLGTSSEGNKDTLKHGQFLPYNDLITGFDSEGNPIPRAISTQYVNERDIHANPLSSLDPRKGEALYEIPYSKGQTAPAYVDHFFGMEMTARFMQSESGLDAWGHDLIFEFSGDDDFWLYVDDMLVLDIGGIHSALDGSVNFRTGVVTRQWKDGTQTTTLRELYKAAYKQKNTSASEAEVEAWLDTIFKDGGTIFKDYSGHTMRMFYMERGAGASNLHMRFNLAPYTEGEVLLEKEVSGTENIDPDTVFPFQIQYHESGWTEGYYTYATEDEISVTDFQTGDPIPYRASYEVGGLTYPNVFLLKAGQTASIKLKDEDVSYFITECGMDTAIYDEVKANDAVLTGRVTSVEGRKDYPIEAATVEGRKKVIYDNHVSDGALNSLLITKKLWQDEEKHTPITDDSTGFKFRIYIGKDGENYTVYNTGKYYVKNAEGEYCIYQNGTFVSTGKTDFAQLGTEVADGQWKSEQEQATFHTSPGGAADKIPAGYTVEIPGLMNGTAFFVEERDYEIPAGYHLIDYERTPTPDGETANAGTVRDTDTEVIVNNRHGYGLVVNKVWSDAPFMSDHDEIYFAVYLQGDDNALTLVENSVRQLGKTDTQIRWFFPELAEGKTLNNYLVYEVKLTGTPTADPASGVVSGFTEIERVEEASTLEVGGTSNEHGYSVSYVYTASYERQVLTEEQIHNDVNSRTDIVSNSRPGIKLVKTDLEGKPLEGGVFTLIKGTDENTKKTFASDENGLIAVAYLTTNEEYTLTEVTAPYKHLSLMDSFTIKVDDNNTVFVNGQATVPSDVAYYTITQVAKPTASNMPTITVKNRPFTLNAVKLDAVSGRPVEGITFELYREVEDYYTGLPMPDYTPMEGFEALVTAADGTIPKINLDDLSAGTYYLHEKDATLAYKELGFDIRLIIASTGQISVQKAEYKKNPDYNNQKTWVFSDFPNDKIVKLSTDESGNITLIVKDQPAQGVQILKKSYDDPNVVLSGVSFELYKLTQLDLDTNQPKSGEKPLIVGSTGEDGIFNLGALARNTTYALIETETLDGYLLPDAPLIITVSSDGTKVTAQRNGTALTVEKVKISGEDVFRITVYNSTGYELPSTGGMGPLAFQLPGAVMMLGAAVWQRRRRKKRE